MRPLINALVIAVLLQGGGIVNRLEAVQPDNGPARIGSSAGSILPEMRKTVGAPLLSPALQTQQPATASAVQLRSRIEVTVPRDNAELQVDEKTMPGDGPIRTLEMQPLESGRTYDYTLTVKWRPNNYTVLSRTRTVTLKAGDDVAVDLSNGDPNDRAEIRYVPTPDIVVNEMIKLAQVTADDVVYEPGCGDARITVAAVKAGAKKGVGIDLDPSRVAEAKAKVENWDLQDRIDIRLGDALDIKDLSEATVVFLYMGDEFDMLIRPILWKQLKVGTRVVSHRFMMGDWEPDNTVTIPVDHENFTVHLWTVTKEIKERAEKM